MDKQELVDKLVTVYCDPISSKGERQTAIKKAQALITANSDLEWNTDIYQITCATSYHRLLITSTCAEMFPRPVTYMMNSENPNIIYLYLYDFEYRLLRKEIFDALEGFENTMLFAFQNFLEQRKSLRPAWTDRALVDD